VIRFADRLKQVRWVRWPRLVDPGETSLTCAVSPRDTGGGDGDTVASVIECVVQQLTSVSRRFRARRIAGLGDEVSCFTGVHEDEVPQGPFYTVLDGGKVAGLGVLAPVDTTDIIAVAVLTN
jgi:hypothetical protein